MTDSNRFYSFDLSAFPFTIYLTVSATGELWKAYEVPGPGALQYEGTGGNPLVDVTIVWGDGQVMVSSQDEEEKKEGKA